MLFTGAAVAQTDHAVGSACNTLFTPIGSEGAVTILQIEGSCEVRDLGTVSMQSRQRVVPTGPPVGTTLPVLITSDVIYTVAPGGKYTTAFDTVAPVDKYTTAFVGGGAMDLVTGEVRFAGAEIVTGGVGRFQGASGALVNTGDASTATGRGFYRGEGTLRY